MKAMAPLHHEALPEASVACAKAKELRRYESPAFVRFPLEALVRGGSGPYADIGPGTASQPPG